MNPELQQCLPNTLCECTYKTIGRFHGRMQKSTNATTFWRTTKHADARSCTYAKWCMEQCPPELARPLNLTFDLGASFLYSHRQAQTNEKPLYNQPHFYLGHRGRGMGVQTPCSEHRFCSIIPSFTKNLEMGEPSHAD